jgi:osmoprotectant transport system substrate-binding protein
MTTLRHTRMLAAGLAAATLFLATSCADDDLKGNDSKSSDQPSDQGPVSISGQDFPEAALVAAMYEQLLTDAGYQPDVKLVPARDGYMPTFPDTIDVVPEYVGGIVNFLNARENGDNAQPFEAGDGAQLAADGADLLAGAGISLLDISEATDTNAFFVTQQYSDDNGVTKLSDLEGESVTLAAAEDCEGRLDCEGGLSDQYGIDISEILPLGYASDATYQAVLDGEAQLGETSTTDGSLESRGLVVLEDDQQIQPAQNLVPAVSTDFLDEHPDLADVLNPLMAALTTEKLTELNAKVAIGREKVEDVAAEFLSSEGLVD